MNVVVAGLAVQLLAHSVEADGAVLRAGGEVVVACVAAAQGGQPRTLAAADVAALQADPHSIRRAAGLAAPERRVSQHGQRGLRRLSQVGAASGAAASLRH